MITWHTRIAEGRPKSNGQFETQEEEGYNKKRKKEKKKNKYNNLI